jgi:hypothetical protein
VLEALECCAGAKWRIALGTITVKIKEYYIESRKKGTSHIL